MGLQMLLVAIGWHLYELTGSAYDLGLVGLFQFVPSLALVLVAGHVADRFDRRRVLQLCLIGQLLIALGLMAATLHSWLSREVVFLASLALGTTKAFQMPTQQALTPLLVPPSALPRALAINASGVQGAVIIGPAVGGFVFALGPEIVYILCALMFAISVALIAQIKWDHKPNARQPFSTKNLFAGLHFIWRRQEVLGAISLDLFAVLLGGATALLPIFAKDILHVGPWGFGLLRAAPAVGALGTSLYLSYRPIKRRVGKIMFGAVAGFGISTLIFGLSTSFYLSLFALALNGICDMISVVIRQSLVQLDTPNSMRGRVSAVNSIFIGASNQLGEFESGVTAGWFGAVPSVVIGSLGTLAVVAGGMILFPKLKNREALQQNVPENRNLDIE